MLYAVFRCCFQLNGEYRIRVLLITYREGNRMSTSMPECPSDHCEGLVILRTIYNRPAGVNLLRAEDDGPHAYTGENVRDMTWEEGGVRRGGESARSWAKTRVA